MGALEHSASEVRDTAVRIIQIMYRKNKSAVLEYLPPDDANTRRNILYKNMFDGFAKIDGRPTETQVKVSNQEEQDKTVGLPRYINAFINSLCLTNIYLKAVVKTFFNVSHHSKSMDAVVPDTDVTAPRLHKCNEKTSSHCSDVMLQ